MTMWLPDGWWIITEVTNKGVRFTASANGLPEIESSSKFRSDREATSIARKALRSMAYERQDSGWSKFRCHARLPGQTKAFCGARIEDSPNTKHAYSEQCGNCLRIVESMPDPDEAESPPDGYESGWCLAGDTLQVMDKDEPEKWARIIHPDRHMPASWDGPGDRS